MCSTNGKILVVRNMSDCVINNETFAFPCNTKPIKTATLDGEKFIIESHKKDYFSNDEKEVSSFDWRKVIPTDKPTIEKEYDFSDYSFHIPLEKHSKVTFCSNGEVEFIYDDTLDTIATYSDVVVSNKDSMFDTDKDDKPITECSFPMWQIINMFKDNKNFIYQQFSDERIGTRVFLTKSCKYILMPLYC